MPRVWGSAASLTAMLVVILMVSPQYCIQSSRADAELLPGTDNLVVFNGASYNMTTITVPESDLVSAGINISCQDYAGSWPTSPTADLNNDGTPDWGYDGLGYGALGHQTLFSDGSASKTEATNAAGAIGINIPKNASVISARISANAVPAVAEDSFDHSDFTSFSKTNLVVDASGARLGQSDHSWQQTSRADFLGGTMTNITLNSEPGAIMLASSWALSDWKYRRAIVVNNSYANALVNYPVILTVDTNSLVATGRMRSGLEDVRFTSDTGASLAYWIDTATIGNSTKIYVKTNLTLGDTTIYMYYGNGNASSLSSMTAIFTMIDDFESGSYWTFNTTDLDLRNDGIMSDFYHSPIYSWRLNSKNNQNFATGAFCEIYRNVAVYSSTAYELSVWNRGQNSGDTNSFIHMRVLVDPNVLSDIAIPAGNSIVNWMQRTGSFNTSSTTAKIRLQLYVSIGASGFDTRYVWWDDVRLLQKVSPAPTPAIQAEETSYLLEGYYYSAVYDTSNACAFGAINYSYSLPAGCGMQVNVRTGPTATPDASWSSWTGPYSSGDAITMPAGRYVQYSAYLTSTGTDTPILYDVAIAYSRYLLSGSLTMPEHAYPTCTTINWLRLTYDASAPSGLSAEASFDGGLTWFAIANASNYVPAGTQYRVVVRFLFSSTGATSPLLTHVGLVINTSTNPENLTIDFAGDSVAITTIAGQFTGTQLLNVTADLSSALANASFVEDAYGNRMCAITATITSSTNAFVTFDSLDIKYNYTFRMPLAPYIQGNFPTAGTTFAMNFTSLSTGALLIGLSLSLDLPPTCTAVALAPIYEDTPAIHHVDLSTIFHDDYDDGALSYELISATPSEVAVELDGGFLNFTPAPEWSGTSAFTVRATDSSGFSVSNNFTIDVLPVNDAPSIGGTYYLTGKQGIAFSLLVTNISDIDNATSDLTLFTNLSDGIAVVVITGFNITFNFTTSGIQNFLIGVSDGLLSSTITAVADITPSGAPAIIPPFSNVVMYSNQTRSINLSLHVVEPEGEAVVWSASADTSSLFNYSLVGPGNSTLIIMPFECASGTANVTVRVTDPWGNYDEQTFSVQVRLACNYRPTFVAQPPNVTIRSNESYSMSLIGYAYDPEGDALFWNATCASALVSVSVSGNYLTISSPAECMPGNASVTIFVTDGKNRTLGPDSRSVNVSVLQNCTPPPNHPPTISEALVNITLTSGMPYTINLAPYVSDIDAGDMHNWTVSLQSNDLFNASISVSNLTIVPSGCANGTRYADITVDDGMGGRATKRIFVTMNVTCMPTHVGPAISSIPKQTVSGMGSIELSLSQFAIMGTDPSVVWSVVAYDAKIVNCSIKSGSILVIGRVSKSCANTTVSIRLADLHDYTANATIPVEVIAVTTPVTPQGNSQTNETLMYAVLFLVIIVAIVVAIFMRKKDDKNAHARPPQSVNVQHFEPQVIPMQSYMPAVYDVPSAHASPHEQEMTKPHIPQSHQMQDAAPESVNMISPGNLAGADGKAQEGPKHDITPEKSNELMPESVPESKAETKPEICPSDDELMKNAHDALPAHMKAREEALMKAINVCSRLGMDTTQVEQQMNRLNPMEGAPAFDDKLKVTELYLKVLLKKSVPFVIKMVDIKMNELTKNGIPVEMISPVREASAGLETNFAEGNYVKMTLQLGVLLTELEALVANKAMTEEELKGIGKRPEAPTQQKVPSAQPLKAPKREHESASKTEKKERLVNLDDKTYIIFEEDANKSFQILRGLGEEGTWVAWLTLDEKDKVVNYKIPPNIKVKDLSNKDNHFEAILEEISEFSKGARRFAVLIDFFPTLMAKNDMTSMTRLILAMNRSMKLKNACVLLPMPEKSLSENARVSLKKVATIVDNPDEHINWLESEDKTVSSVVRCAICMGHVKPGLPVKLCSCGKRFHESCASRMGECPSCGRKFV